jgi:hypothetical protein
MPIRIWIQQKDTEPTGSHDTGRFRIFFYVFRIKVYRRRLPGCLLVRYLRTEMQVLYFFYVSRIKVYMRRLPGCLLVRYLRTEMVTVERMLRSGQALSQLLSAQSFFTLQK